MGEAFEKLAPIVCIGHDVKIQDKSDHGKPQSLGR